MDAAADVDDLEGVRAERAPFGFVLALVALATGGFAIGTTEFITMGVLPQIAEAMKVSEPTAGHAISAYALGVMVGVPILSFFGASLPKRALLMWLMVGYAAFNVLSAVSASYGMLTLARFLDGLPHGAYFGVASMVAAALADPQHRGRAVAMVMMGLAVANVIGVPFATWLGQEYGWRLPYLVCAALALLTVVMVGVFVPRVHAPKGASGRAEAAHFFGSLQVWLTMLAGCIGFGGMFATYSYIATTVTDVTDLGKSWVPVFVLAFGLGMVAGTAVAGELVRRGVFKTLVLGTVAEIAVLVLYWLVSPVAGLFLPVVFLVTFFSSFMSISLQIRLMDVAGHAVTLGAAMNHATLNVANAIGAFFGGLVIAWGWGYRAPALVGALLAFLGLVIILVSGALHRSRRLTPTFPAEERV